VTPGYVIARKLTAPPAGRTFPVRVQKATARSLTVHATPATVTPGEWGVFLRSGGHLRVSGSALVDGTTATWRVDGDMPRVAADEQASWSGIVAPTPDAAGMAHQDHLFQCRAGAVPAWFIGAAAGEANEVWAVHLHGMGSSRAGTLRGVVAARDAGLPSVVPAYRNTVEGPRVGGGRSHLGHTEADDVSDVLEQLSLTGRERFVLYGWSMGAQIALRLAASRRWRERVVSVVLDSPVLDWRGVIRANTVHSRLPASVARLAESWLENPRKARFVGLDTALRLDSMDWVSRAADIHQPVLIHHGTEDWSVPISSSEAFVAAAPQAQLIPAAGAGHTTSWNVGAEAYHARTSAFMRAARP
jgi:pimeloyl-ACP methyl ester carboxylesterase